MTAKAKYPAQIIAMVTPETKQLYKDEAERREISISELVREALEFFGQPVRWLVGEGDVVKTEYISSDHVLAVHHDLDKPKIFNPYAGGH